MAAHTPTLYTVCVLEGAQDHTPPQIPPPTHTHTHTHTQAHTHSHWRHTLAGTGTHARTHAHNIRRHRTTRMHTILAQTPPPRRARASASLGAQDWNRSTVKRHTRSPLGMPAALRNGWHGGACANARCVPWHPVRMTRRTAACVCIHAAEAAASQAAASPYSSPYLARVLVLNVLFQLGEFPSQVHTVEMNKRNPNKKTTRAVGGIMCSAALVWAWAVAIRGGGHE